MKTKKKSKIHSRKKNLKSLVFIGQKFGPAQPTDHLAATTGSSRDSINQIALELCRQIVKVDE